MARSMFGAFRTLKRDIDELKSAVMSPQSFEEFTQTGEGVFAQLFELGVFARNFCVANSLLAYLKARHKTNIRDVYLFLLVGEICNEMEMLTDLRKFKTSRFVRSLGISDANHHDAIYRFLRAWIGPESIVLGKTPEKRLENYLQRMVMFPDNPEVVHGMTSTEITLAGLVHESIMLLDRSLKLKYFGVSMIVHTYLQQHTGKSSGHIAMTDLLAVDLSHSVNVLSGRDLQLLQSIGISFSEMKSKLESLQCRVKKSKALVLSNDLTHGSDQIVLLNKDVVKEELRGVEVEILDMFPTVMLNEMKYRSYFEHEALVSYLSNVLDQKKSLTLLHPVGWERVRQSPRLDAIYMLETYFRTTESSLLRGMGFGGIDMIQRNTIQLLRKLGVGVESVSQLFETKDYVKIRELVLDDDLGHLGKYLTPEISDSVSTKGMNNLMKVLKFHIAYFEYHNIIQIATDSRFLLRSDSGINLPSKKTLWTARSDIRMSLDLTKSVDYQAGKFTMAHITCNEGTGVPLFEVLTCSGRRLVVIDSDVFDRPLLTHDGQKKLVFGPRIYKEGSAYKLLPEAEIESLGGIVIHDVGEFLDIVDELNLKQREFGVGRNKQITQVDKNTFTSLKAIEDFFTTHCNLAVAPIMQYFNDGFLKSLFGRADTPHGLLSFHKMDLHHSVELMTGGGRAAEKIAEFVSLKSLRGFESYDIDETAIHGRLFPKISGTGTTLGKMFKVILESFNSNVVGMKSLFSSRYFKLKNKSVPNGKFAVVDQHGSQVMLGNDQLYVHFNEKMGKITIRKLIGSAHVSVIDPETKQAIITEEGPVLRTIKQASEFPFLSLLAGENCKAALEVYWTRKFKGFANKYDLHCLEGRSLDEVLRNYGVINPSRFRKSHRIKTLDELISLVNEEYDQTATSHFVTPRPNVFNTALGMSMTIRKHKAKAGLNMFFNLSSPKYIPCMLRPFFRFSGNNIYLVKQGVFTRSNVQFLENWHDFNSFFALYSSITSYFDSLLMFIDTNDLGSRRNMIDEDLPMERFWKIMVRTYVGCPDEALCIAQESDKLQSLARRFKFRIHESYQEDTHVKRILFQPEVEKLSGQYDFADINIGKFQFFFARENDKNRIGLISSMKHQLHALLSSHVLTWDQIQDNIDNWKKVHVDQSNGRVVKLGKYLREKADTTGNVVRYLLSHEDLEIVFRVLGTTYLAPRTIIGEKLITPASMDIVANMDVGKNILGFNKVFKGLIPVMHADSQEHKFLTSLHDNLDKTLSYPELYRMLEMIANTLQR